MIDFVKYRKWFYLLTGLMAVGGVIALIVPPHLPYGQEFTGGSTIDVTFTGTSKEVTADEVRAKLGSIGIGNTTIQRAVDPVTGQTSFFIRSPFVEESFAKRLEERFGKVQVTGFEDATDMATTITLFSPVSAAQVTAAFGLNAPQGLKVIPLSGQEYLAYAPRYSQAQRSTLASGLEKQYGKTTVGAFDGTDDFAVTYVFDNQPVAAQVQQEARTAGNASIIATRLDERTIFLAGRNLAGDAREKLFATLDEKFRGSERMPFDYAKGQAFTVALPDPITTAQVEAELARLVAAKTVAGRGLLSRAGDGVLLLRAPNVLPQELQDIVAALNQEFQGVQSTSLDGAGNVALNLDFGPAVDIGTVQAEAARQEIKDLAVGNTGTNANTFSLVAEKATKEQRGALLASLEARFGFSRKTTYDTAGSLVAVYTFQEPAADRNGILNELAALSLPNLVVEAVGERRFLIATTGANSLTEGQIRDALISKYGPILSVERLAAADSLATILDFGPAVAYSTFKDAVAEAKVAGLFSADSTGTGYFLGGTGVTAAQVGTALSAIEAKLGLAKQTPLDFTKGQAATLRLTNPAGVSAAVKKALILEKTRERQFFIGGHGLTSDDQAGLQIALSEAFGGVQQAAYNFANNIASTLAFTQPVSEADLKAYLEPFGYRDLTVQERPEGLFIRGTRALDDQRSTIIAALELIAPVDRESLEFSSVDAEIAQRSILNTLWAVLAGTIGILAYVWWAFRRIPKSIRFGFAAIAGLSHDVLVILGVFGLLAKFTDVEINSLMIVGILAIIGYSVNNTIVVFDRIRETQLRNQGKEIETIVNMGINDTLTRNLNTSITTIIAILAVLFFGGPTIRDFLLVILVGVIAGTYGSIFLAGNILVSWERGELRQILWPFRKKRAAAAP
ncbi:MAG: protein translocase subunit SecF [Dehalococcoidia bacterium]|nr:protein translocase subunit SecF [Dehalococcoidia bacterium]